MHPTLAKYRIEFTVQAIYDGKRVACMVCMHSELLNYHLSYYFLNQPMDFLTDDVLTDLEKAIAGEPFDSDAGGTLSFLTIGAEQSIFSGTDEARADIAIPTAGVKDIVLEWTQWVIGNQLQEYVL